MGDTANNLKNEGGKADGPSRVSESAQALELALKIDQTVKTVRHDDWRGVQSREQVIKAALYKLLEDAAEVERIFLIIKAQREY